MASISRYPMASKRKSCRISTSWPLLVVLGILQLSAGLCISMALRSRHINLTGYQAGVLPDGVTVKTWEDAEKIVSTPIEQLSKTLLANPMVLAMVYTVGDGIATMDGTLFGMVRNILSVMQSYNLRNKQLNRYFMVKEHIIALVKT